MKTTHIVIMVLIGVVTMVVISTRIMSGGPALDEEDVIPIEDELFVDQIDEHNEEGNMMVENEAPIEQTSRHDELNHTTTLNTDTVTTLDTGDATAHQNSIELSPPVIEYALLPGSSVEITPKVRYSGEGILRFSLIQSPPGMTIQERTGNLQWTPTDDHAGQVFTVQMSAADGDTSTSMTFPIRVGQPKQLSTQVEVLDDGRTKITVMESGLTLDQLTLFLPKDFTASEYVASVRNGIPGVALIDPLEVPMPDHFSPEYAIRLTEFFRIEPVSTQAVFIEVHFPPLVLPAGRHPEELVLYVYGDKQGFWIPVTHALRMTEDDTVIVTIAITGGPMAIGLDSAR